MSTKLFITVIRAEGILAADKGGTSDAYATAELVESATGKPIKPARKTKTRTIKKTLAPEWNEDEVEWGNISLDASGLSVKVTVFDADMMSSETLGGVTIPVSVLTEDTVNLVLPLEAAGQMKVEATGTIRLRGRLSLLKAAGEEAGSRGGALTEKSKRSEEERRRLEP